MKKWLCLDLSLYSMGRSGENSRWGNPLELLNRGWLLGPNVEEEFGDLKLRLLKWVGLYKVGLCTDMGPSPSHFTCYQILG